LGSLLHCNELSYSLNIIVSSLFILSILNTAQTFLGLLRVEATYVLFVSLQVLNKLKEVGVENINDVTVIEDPSNTGVNRGFAFLELETHKDALTAFRTLRKKNAFGEDRTIKVAWAQPLNDPDEDVMEQV
jgi:RNA recognition motif-containing protein